MAAGERGNVTVLLAALLVVALLLCTAVARLAGAAREKARAENAADAAALAAADGMALGDTVAHACARAKQTAAENGARLLSCADANSGMQVSVQLDRARSEARAEFTRFATESTGPPLERATKRRP
jgi:secretion/DNA translocation related TadE-like protein